MDLWITLVHDGRKERKKDISRTLDRFIHSSGEWDSVVASGHLEFMVFGSLTD